VTNLTIFPGNLDKDLYTIQEPYMKFPSCEISKQHKFTQTKTSSMYEPTFEWDPQNCLGALPCWKILITPNDYQETIQLKIETTFVTLLGNLVHLSPMITVNVPDCVAN
jgi:hypothetical protein